MGMLKARVDGAWVPISAGVPVAPMSCFLTKSATQNIANVTEQMVTFDVEVFDNGGLHDNAVNPSRITIPANGAGLWLVGYQLSWFTSAAGTLRYSRLTGSLGQFMGHVEHFSDGSNRTYGATSPMRFTAGQYVEILVYQASGGALGLRSNATAGSITNFWATRLGD